MRVSPMAGGIAVAAVEQFVGLFSLSTGARLGEWIVGSRECGQSAGGLDLGAAGRAKDAWNGRQRIVNLLSGLRISFIYNVLATHYLVLSGFEVVISGLVGGLKQGGRGSRLIRALGPYNPSAAAKSFGIAHGPKIGRKKTGGRGRSPTTTRHTTMNKPRCSQCGLTSTIDCMEDGCPGVAGFHPSTWARPLIQMATDLERYETLILKLSDHMDTMPAFDEGGHIARLICDEAQKIQKKRRVA